MPRFVCVTGGPGAGKTALLEVARRELCDHVVILPESAGILFKGGFPHGRDDLGRRGTQRAIYHVQDALERIARERGGAALVLCDRGTLDGAAYWPGPAQGWYADLGTTQPAELARYVSVIHLAVPPPSAYRRDPIRIENAEEAAAIDLAIAAVWSAHPNRHHVSAAEDFLTKIAAAMRIVTDALPRCCQAGSLTPRPERSRPAP